MIIIHSRSTTRRAVPRFGWRGSRCDEVKPEGRDHERMEKLEVLVRTEEKRETFRGGRNENAARVLV